MKISYRLLNEYINLDGVNPYIIAPAIAEHCFEVESITEVGAGASHSFNNVFAAKVVEVEKHPNADRLRVVQLDLGGRTVGPVVCGAWNFEAGDVVALALPGAHIPQNIHSDAHESFELGTAKIRGIESQGMICSAFELGLSGVPEEKPEILVLPKNTKPGIDLKEYLSADSKKVNADTPDYLLDFAMPANRPDLHSHIGVAQELSGMLGYKKTKFLIQAQQEMAAAKSPKYSSKANTAISIKSDACGLYLGARLKVRVGLTPQEILAPLRTLGHDGVNNVVDITNFVMAETGQPLHAYDASRIEGDIIVRNATKGEKVPALDGKTYELPESAMVIADKCAALGIAGIIGGENSKILPETTEIILEVALFDRVAIRRASKTIGLRTDASALFEKGTAPQQAIYAFNRAVKLLEHHAGGVVLETFGSPPHAKNKPRTIKFTAAQINGILGGTWSDAQMKKLLNGLGITTTGTHTMIADIPWYRSDIEDVAGLADEVLRSVGMNTILKQPLQLARVGLQYNREAGIWNAKDAAAKLGYGEVQGYSFISGAEITAAGRNLSDFMKVSNPLSAETEYLRDDIGKGLLKIVGTNAKHSDNFKLFEIGFGYHGYGQEKLYLGLAIYRRQQTPERLVAEIKGDLEAFIHQMGIDGSVTFSPFGNAQNTNSFDLAVADGQVKQLGTIVVADPTYNISRRYDLDHEVVMAQLELDAVLHLAAATPETFKPFSRFPESSLDVSVVVADSIEWHLIEEILRYHGGSLLKSVQMIDAPYYYTKATMPSFHKNLAKEGRKNLVFRLVFADNNGTLQDSKISEMYAKIKVYLQSKIGA